jgi:phosphonate transport system substrate-binding protein
MYDHAEGIRWIKLLMFHHRTRTTVTLMTVLIVAIATASFSFAAEQPVFKVGFDVRNTQLEDAKQYQPFLYYLARATGYRFEIRFSKNGEYIADLLGTGKMDFAFIGAHTYLEAREKYGVIPLVRGINSQGKAEYQSAIVVKNNSPLKNIVELRGKRFAFGSQASTQGHLIPLIELAEHGLSVKDLASYGFTGSHRNCAKAVAKGEFDAGGMQDQLAKEYAAEGILKVIHMSSFYPSSGVAANKKVPVDVLKRVKQAFIDFQPKGRDAKGLYNWDKTEMPNGFKESRDSDYGELRKYALKFNLLQRKGP